MKGMVYCLSVMLLFITACDIKSSKNPSETREEQNDGVEIRKQPFRNSDQIEYEISVVKGTMIKHGIQKRYYLHGSLYSKIPYIAGKKQGVAYTYYQAALDGEPQVWKEQPYEDDQLHGICKRYHRDGSLQAEYEYKNGLRATGLKEYSEYGKVINQPQLILTRSKVNDGFFISASLSDNQKNVDYYLGELIEEKYLPEKMDELQVVSGVGQIVVPASGRTVTITAEYFTRYRNRGLVSAQIDLP